MWICPHCFRLPVVQENTQRKGNANIRRLAAPLQWSRSNARAESFEKDESLLYSQGHRNLEICSQPPKSELALSLERHDSARGFALSPCKEAYAVLKEAVVGGQSVVFKRYHEAGVTLYKTALFYKPKVCKRIISYDTNVLYLSTICREKCLAGR